MSITVTNAVGRDIRSLRKSRELSLSHVAEGVDRSVGWLSQVERGVSEPSIADLRRIAGLFDIPVSFFFRNEDAAFGERGLIVRAASRAQLGGSDTGLVEELLSPDLSGDFEMIRSVFTPGAKSGQVAARSTQEGGYVVSGGLALTIGTARHELRPGDSFQFQNQSYEWATLGDAPCVIIWVISPPSY